MSKQKFKISNVEISKFPSNNVGGDVSQTASMEEMLHKIVAQTKSMANIVTGIFLEKT